MDRRGWIDVAIATVILIVWNMSWRLVLRDRLGLSGPVGILLTLIALIIAVLTATRSLRRRVNVWQRLYPITLIPLGLAMYEPWVLRGPPEMGAPALVLLALVGLGPLLLTTNAVYAFVWVIAWGILRRRNEFEEPDGPPPLRKRPGVYVWLGTLILGGVLLAAGTLADRLGLLG
jgi:hypothetical protein